MNSVSLNIDYRPIRVGFCLRDGDLASVTRAMRYAHTIWGGRLCPIIPIDDTSYAQQLVDSFDVDVLFPITEDAEMARFLAKFKHLSWPFFHKEFWVEQDSGKSPQLLSVGHPLRHIAARRQDLIHSPTVLFKWDKADPLAHWLLAMVGAYPELDDKLLPDYEVIFRDHLGAAVRKLDSDSKLPPNLVELITPNAITAFDLYLKRGMGFGRSEGVYVAPATDFIDLVVFWNLRANGANLSFYSVAANERLESVKDRYLKKTEGLSSGGENEQIEIAVWGRDRAAVESLGLKNCYYYKVSPSKWDSPKVGCPHFVSSRRRSVLAVINDESTPPAMSLPLPDKPFFDDIHLYNQHVIASISSYSRRIFSDSDYVFPPPPVSKLNEFYARALWHEPSNVRVSKEGVGFIVGVTDENLQLRAIDKFDAFQKLFELVGIKIERSQPGLVANRLIEQMGDLQGCWVFKIPGVRELIAKYKPTESFTHSGAIQMIRSGSFSEHKSLYIEQRKHKDLKPEDVFQFLLQREVFRAGLELLCPNCELTFWKHIDECQTKLSCEYCGSAFNITPQLHHRGDWRFRRSGLFGKDDHQGGSVPVVLALQQLDTAVLHGSGTYCTSVNLQPINDSIDACESDFIITTTNPDGVVEIALSECKTNDEITEKDVANLCKVADCLTAFGFHAYVIFSKTGSFSADEISRCKKASTWSNGGMILLSGRELEPYFIYENIHEQVGRTLSAGSFRSMVKATHTIYFDSVGV